MTSSVEELFDAARRGSVQELRQLLSGDSASLVDSRDHEGNTLLHVATEKGDPIDVVTELIKMGAKPLTANSRGDTPLHLAALRGRKAVVKGLQTADGCRARGQGGRTALHCACEGACPPEVVAELITACKSDPLASDSDGRIPLHLAALHGREKVVKDLMTNFKCPVDSTDNVGYTPLHCACQNDHMGVVKLLVKSHKASLTHVNAEGLTALEVAAANGKAATVELLLTKFGCSANSQTRGGRTLLHLACASSSVPLATDLLKKYKCNPNAQDADKATPLHIAAQGGNSQLIDLLIENRAEVGGTDAQGNTPLHYACQNGHAYAARALYDHGADKKARNSEGRNALDLAAISGHASVVKEMISRGCDPNVKDSAGRTCLHQACCSGQKEVVELLVHRSATAQGGQGEERTGEEGEQEGNPPKFKTEGQVEEEEEEGFEEVTVEMFRCPVDSPDLQGRTPFHCACEFGHVDVVRSLLSLGANIRARDNRGDTGMHLAAASGHASVILHLVNNCGLDPNVNGGEGRTPLHWACVSGHTHLVEDFLKLNSCDVVAKDDHGSTPLHLAAQNGGVGVVQTLLSVGCCPPDITDSKGSTPLHHACALGHLEVVKVLVGGGASLLMHNTEGHAPLHLAVLGNRREVVETLLGTLHFNPCNPSLMKKPLHLACSRGHLEIMSLLVAGGCGLTELDKEGYAPIHVAAMLDQGDAVRELVGTFKCPVNFLDTKGNTALHHACEVGHIATVKVLQALGVDLDAQNSDGDAALHVAAANGHREVLKALVKYGCSINYRSGYRKRVPLHYACSGGHLEMVRDLVRKFRCDVGTQDENGLTPLHVAVVSGKVEVVRELVEVFRCSLVVTDTHGCTPLRYACWGNRMDMIRILCSLEPRPPPSPSTTGSAPGMDPSPEVAKEGTPTNSRPGTPTSSCTNPPGTPVIGGGAGGKKMDRKALHYACEGSNVEVVRELIGRYKFDVNEEDPKGFVPLHLAAQSGREEVVGELLALISHPIDRPNTEGQSPLLLASEKGSVGVVRLLLGRGADPTLKDSTGRNAITKAMEAHHDQVVEVFVGHSGWKTVFDNITEYTEEHKKKYTETLHRRKDKLTTKISQVDKELKDAQERCKDLEKENATCREQCEQYRTKLEEYTKMNLALLEEKKHHFEEEKLALESSMAKIPADMKSDQVQDQARRISISTRYKGMEHRLSIVNQQIKQLQSSVRSPSKTELRGTAQHPGSIECAPNVTELLNDVVPHIQGQLSGVGLQLGLTQEVLEGISADPSEEQRWTKLFVEWKEKGTKPFTWGTLLGVLEDPAVNCVQLAKSLRSRIMGEGVAAKERSNSISSMKAPEDHLNHSASNNAM